MANILYTLDVTKNAPFQHVETDQFFWMQGICSWCGPTQFYILAARTEHIANQRVNDYDNVWMRCVTCHRGALRVGGVTYPGVAPVAAVNALPEDVENAWNEARNCLGAGAYTAAVMMCRKLLFHIAVEKKLPEKNANGRAPTFRDVLEHLKEIHIVTPVMEKWVEKIREVGNEANHDLSKIEQAKAEQVAKFTRQLLVLTYEMPAELIEDLAGE